MYFQSSANWQLEQIVYSQLNAITKCPEVNRIHFLRKICIQFHWSSSLSPLKQFSTIVVERCSKSFKLALGQHHTIVIIPTTNVRIAMLSYINAELSFHCYFDISCLVNLSNFNLLVCSLLKLTETNQNFCAKFHYTPKKDAISYAPTNCSSNFEIE